MGRDWYWSGKSSSTSTAAKKDSETPGCMSGVLHLFDFHQFQFPMTQPPRFKPSSSLPQQDPTSSVKGVKAPRNSLESNEGVIGEGLELKQEDFDISMELRKEAGHVKTRIDDQLSCSDSSNSPGPKTPSLVARLMGLDILPDSVSSSSSPSSVRLSKVRDGKQIQNMNKIKKQKMNFAEFENTGSRSLPDTPRISSARRSDVDPRHSLQIYREYIPSSGELDYSGRISKDQKSRKRELRNEEENRSPGHYARQIVKQVKESVSRRVGLDITNTITTTSPTTPTNTRLNSKDVDVVILKSKKPKRLSKIGEESNSNKHLNSPRLRLCVQEPPPPPRAILTEKIKNSTNAMNQKKSKFHQVPQQEKCKKASCERFAQPTKSKTRSSRTGSASTSTSTSSSRNDDQGSKPSSRLSSSPSRITCAAPALHTRDNFADEIRYVSEILKCTGIHNDTLVSFTRWYSPSHPLDPSLFSYLENFASPVPRWNRRLMFDLVDEILVAVIRPYLNMKPWVESRLRRKEMRGEQLLQHLCYEISSFPSSNCQTLEDIDELVGKDLPGRGELCAESIVVEVERDILDTLVHEVAEEVVHSRKEMWFTDTIGAVGLRRGEQGI